MNEDDCRSLVRNANMTLLSIVDIFYYKGFHFTVEDANDKSNRNPRNDVNFLYETNSKAAETVREKLF